MSRSFHQHAAEPRGSGRHRASATLVGALGLSLFLTAAAQAQHRAISEDAVDRSGQVSRSMPVLPRLPNDADRDSFQGTRYADEHDCKHKLHPRNSWLDGGMYGRPFCKGCTAAVAPYFRGLPGGRIGPECYGGHPVKGRWVDNFINPFKPVGMYYDRGVYAPIYDFDYFVPGPGPFPWSHFFKRPTGG